MIRLFFVLSSRNIFPVHRGNIWKTIGNTQSTCSKNTSASDEHNLRVSNKLTQLLKCSNEKANAILNKIPSIRSKGKIPAVRQNINMLEAVGIELDTIHENCFLLIMDKGNSNTLGS